MRNARITTRGGGKRQASPEVFQRLAELHQLIIQAEDTLADLKKEYAALKRMLSKARLILTSELRFALDVSEEDATKRLDRALPKVELPEDE